MSKERAVGLLSLDTVEIDGTFYVQEVVRLFNDKQLEAKADAMKHGPFSTRAEADRFAVERMIWWKGLRAEDEDDDNPQPRDLSIDDPDAFNALLEELRRKHEQ